MSQVVLLTKPLLCPGHQSTDVQRYSIRFLQLFITQTSNLQKMMHAYVVYGLESPILSVQFGSLNALSHLFIRPEMRAENLNPLICSLARILVRTQSANPHLFYPTYTTLERFNALLGAKRFFSFLCDSEIPNIAVLYENIQKRAPSPRIFIEASGISSRVSNGVFRFRFSLEKNTARSDLASLGITELHRASGKSHPVWLVSRKPGRCSG